MTIEETSKLDGKSKNIAKRHNIGIGIRRGHSFINQLNRILDHGSR
jgi:hypothetical protein